MKTVHEKFKGLEMTKSKHFIFLVPVVMVIGKNYLHFTCGSERCLGHLTNAAYYYHIKQTVS